MSDAIEAAIDAWFTESAEYSDGDFRVRMEAAIAAYLEAQWQPIETAPKDGTPILVEGGTVEWQASGWFSHSAQRTLQWCPKVWQRLPEPPKEAK